MAEASKFTESLKSPFQWIVVGLMLLFLVVISLSPINVSSRQGPQSRAMQASHAIGIAMFLYAQDHNGTYPTGKSSTEVFQKLINGKYVNDPGIFWLALPGKTKATSNVLKPENVSFDVTVPLDASSSDMLPVVFATGYRVSYVPGGSAVPLFSPSQDWPHGIPVHYHGNNAIWLKNDGQPDGAVTNFISQAFEPAGKKYQQLTPDGPLP